MEESVIIEIRAGTGGEEAALFVADLFKMYQSFGQRKNFSVTVFDSTPTSIGGLKKITFEIKGVGVLNLLRHEGGVHRIQRIPKTEKGGRIHTSTATVAVLKQAKKRDFNINPREIKVEFFRSSGPGGQNVNKRETAVRITHLPTGISVESQTERGQQTNREFAMNILRARLLQQTQQTTKNEQQARRRAQIGSAERSEKIRTYNISQNRLTDHRIKKSWHNLDDIMAGQLDKVLSSLEKLNP